MIRKLTTVLSFVAASCASASTIPAVDPTKALVIGTPIAGATMKAPMQYLIKTAVEGTTKEVHMVINSPGGSVASGEVFINLMKLAQSKGTKFVCYVPQLAASMAFSILMQCDERYSLSTAGLLWHRARISFGGSLFGGDTVLTGPQLVNMGDELLDTDNNTMSELIRKLGKEINPARIAFHFEQETMHSGISLHRKAPSFITPADVIPGLIETLLNKKVPHSEVPKSMFDKLVKPGEVIYIAPTWKPEQE